MARLHHATAKRAEEHGVTITGDDDNWTATKGSYAITHEKAGTALDGVLFAASLAASYPAITLTYEGDEWAFRHHSSPDTEPLLTTREMPTNAIIADLQEACDELELDIEEGFDEDEDDQKTGSVVDPSYKRQYAEDGHPNNNGDWLNGVFATLKLVVAEGKKTRTDVQELNTLFADNGIISEDHKFGGAFHSTSPRTNGWEGRFRMSGGNMLRRKISDAGVLIAFGESIPVPEAFAAKHRTKVKAKKAATTTDETTEAGA